MNNQLKLQEEFQALGGQTIGKLGYVPTVEERKLRLKLALEELCELAEAYGMINYFMGLMDEKATEDSNIDFDSFNYNAIEALDATIDIAVINNGTIITNGHQEIFDKGYELVDANNKTKFMTTIEQAQKTVDKLTETGKEDLTIDEVKLGSFNWYVVKNSSGKILKPYDYEPVDLTQLFNA